MASGVDYERCISMNGMNLQKGIENEQGREKAGLSETQNDCQVPRKKILCGRLPFLD